MTSPDGINWTARTSAADNSWRGVCWASELSLFVAVAYTGTGDRVMTSPDGINWTARASAADNGWQSVCWASAVSYTHLLRESGFKRFPVLAPRWVVRGGDIYGESPAMTALGDINQLQHEQLRKAQGIDYQTKPPLQAPTSMKNRDVEMLPGGITYVDSANPHGGIRSAFEAQINLNYLLEDIRDVRDRIRGCFFADLFLMLANQTRCV